MKVNPLTLHEYQIPTCDNMWWVDDQYHVHHPYHHNKNDLIGTFWNILETWKECSELKLQESMGSCGLLYSLQAVVYYRVSKLVVWPMLFKTTSNVLQVWNNNFMFIWNEVHGVTTKWDVVFGFPLSVIQPFTIFCFKM